MKLQKTLFFSLIILILLSCTSLPTQSQQHIILLSNELSKFNITPYLEIIEDPEKKLTIQDVVSEKFSYQFKPHNKTALTQGLSGSRFWFRFKLTYPPNKCSTVDCYQNSMILKNSGAEHTHLKKSWILDFGTPWLIDFALYQPICNLCSINKGLNSKTERTIITKTEKAISNNREAFARMFVISLSPDFCDNEYFYLYLESIGPLNMPIYVWAEEAFKKYNTLDFLWFGIGYGTIFSMIAFNLFAYKLLHDKMHLYFSFQMVATMLYQLCTFGHSVMIFPMDIKTWAVLLYLFFGLATFWSVIFNMNFLKTAIYTPILHRIMQIYIVLSIIVAGFGIANEFFISQIIASIIGIIFPILSIIIGVCRLRQDFHPATFFLIAWAMVLVGIFLWALRAVGIIPHFQLFVYIFFGCNVLEAVFLSFALADRIKILQNEKEQLLISKYHYKNLSITDELTTLYNKRYFLNVLQQEISQAILLNQPLTLIMADVDYFKKFNDTYGHVEGDVVLAALGNIMRSCLRERDHGCRYGGEEFAVILSNTSAQDGFIIAERIRNKFVSHLFVVNGAAVTLTVSLGVNELSKSDSFEEFVKKTDNALYKAKANGRNRTVIS